MREVHRVVFPENGDPDTLALYVDLSTTIQPIRLDVNGLPRQTDERPVVTAGTDDGLEFSGRHTLTVAHGSKASLATYFNAFPASYWRAWTDVTEVELRITLGSRAQVGIYKSNPRGDTQRVEYLDAEAGTVSRVLPLTSFGDGGWYWFDVHAKEEDAVLEGASWFVDEARARRRGTASVGITTFNRPDYCLAQLQGFAADDGLADYVDTVYVVDQGNRLVSDEEGYDEAAAALGDRLRLLRQGNLGGSGGFSRAMAETVRAGASDYVLLLDDDVVTEPEGIRRAVTFADFCRVPTIVGGHMFSMYAKSQLHAFGEKVNLYRTWWGPHPDTEPAHDLVASPLRATRWMHKRIDVDYNGWWMSLIPVEVIREIGLALPVFIKWDDSEYSLRAREAGYPTVSLPGAAVWHVPWTDKDDSIDWQAYYHQRNRWLVALMHTPYRRPGSLPRESFAADVKHLLTLQYSAVELRLKGLEDVLSGPDHLHESLGSSLAEVRALRANHPDAAVSKDPADFPRPSRRRPPPKGKEPSRPRSGLRLALSALGGGARQLRPVHATAQRVPEERVAAAAAKWWRLSHVDSALVTSADGSGVSMYVREPETFRAYLTRSILLHRTMLARWSSLRREYRAAAGRFTSLEAWEATFAANPAQDG
ncbi:glycosyltransferase [Phycicoccus endophyticus]|uniref:Glycosyltransferase n=1 Tax=Phycicoccus endophyticus TaxID=1690220 RepID=A0A7G9R318_9MICO|nr:glycosyltransferase [Phycicoccus endophyticus]NHI20288.1 glycosyltransferase family 2 protein [Phycicoccus endophyticus]QNN49993.1 glycosyltransferase [Phycicoccus endophyticus]GGL28991.1 glycosyl transferase [Phycicoccus endophyticus]